MIKYKIVHLYISIKFYNQYNLKKQSFMGNSY